MISTIDEGFKKLHEVAQAKQIVVINDSMARENVGKVNETDPDWIAVGPINAVKVVRVVGKQYGAGKHMIRALDREELMDLVELSEETFG